MKRILALCIVLILIFTFMIPSMSYADPMTLTQISSLAYAMGSSFGFGWTFSNADSTGVNDYLNREINSWLGGRSVADAFGTTPAQIIAGKLIIPHLLYNGIKEFLSDYKDLLNPTTNYTYVDIQYGNYRYIPYGLNAAGDRAVYRVYNISAGTWDEVMGGQRVNMDLANDGVRVKTISSGLEIVGVYSYIYVGSRKQAEWHLGYASSQPFQAGVKFYGGIPETVLNPDQEWSGTIGGEDWPDTNLDELLGHIDELVLDGDLTVEGEIVEPVVPPTPAPTPAPIDPDTPLQDVPWEGLNDLIDITGKDITDSIDDVAGDIVEGLDEQTGVISGAIDQAISDSIAAQQEAIREQTEDITAAQEATTEAVESLEGTIAEALQPEEIDEKTFDLRELFPFCIPFDIYHLLQKFDGSPSAPHVRLPIVIPSIGFSYTLDLDFSAWDPVAAAMRTVELIVYALGLAWATSKVIKW